MNIRKSIICAFIISFCCIMGADASRLPNDVWKYIQSNLPDAKQRFDSIVTLDNGEMYIPLTPPSANDVNEIKIEYTYPNNRSLKQLPEVVLFNNGYSLLKVFKDETGNYSLTKNDNLPIKVRLGLMPQDMLTPIGLKLPDSLKLTLGDLLIPSKEETSLTRLDNQDEKSPNSPAVRRNEFISAENFNNKKIFINPKNSKFLEVYDKTSINPLYELKLSAMPQKIIMGSNSDIALIMYWNSKQIDIINLKDENIIAKIEVDNIPSDAVLNEKENIVYVASSIGRAIYFIDLNSAQLKKVVKLDQQPSLITYCELDESVSFYDENISRIFNITKNQDNYIVQPIKDAENLSKILSDVANIYTISRTKNEIKVFDKVNAKLISTIDVSKKPTDAFMYGTRIYILCSKDGYLDVYDTVQEKIVSHIELSKNNFYSKITKIPDENNILITGLNSDDYVIYNLDTLELVQKQNSYVNVSNIVIINKLKRP